MWPKDERRLDTSWFLTTLSDVQKVVVYQALRGPDFTGQAWYTLVKWFSTAVIRGYVQDALRLTHADRMDINDTRPGFVITTGYDFSTASRAGDWHHFSHHCRAAALAIGNIDTLSLPLNELEVLAKSVTLGSFLTGKPTRYFLRQVRAEAPPEAVRYSFTRPDGQRNHFLSLVAEYLHKVAPHASSTERFVQKVQRLFADQLREGSLATDAMYKVQGSLELAGKTVTIDRLSVVTEVV